MTSMIDDFLRVHDMKQKRGSCMIVLMLVLVAGSGSVFAQYGSDSRYDRCRSEASRVSGFYGQEAPSFIEGSVRGSLRGAAVGAAGGWVTGNRPSKAAKRGAALGALIGGARAASAQRELDDRREVFYRVFDRCMNGYD
jgi:hypothetical protein